VIEEIEKTNFRIPLSFKNLLKKRTRFRGFKW